MNNLKKAVLYLCLLAAFLIPGCSSLSGSGKEEVVEIRNKAVGYAEAGNNYYTQAMYNQAVEFFRLALANYGVVYYEPGIIQSYNSLGKTYLAMGQLESATNAFNNAFRLAEKYGDDKYKSQCANHIGELYLNTEKYPDALRMFEQALQFAEKSSPEEDKAIIFHNIGIVHKRMENQEAALEFFAQALKINTRKKLYEEIATNYYMLASVYSEKEEYQTALTNALLALENDKFVENSLGIAKDYYALGIISGKAGNTQDSYEYFKKALFVYQSLEIIFPDFAITRDKNLVLDYLINLAGKLGNAEEASYYETLKTGE